MRSLTVPPQSTPVLSESGLFLKIWYLFFNRLAASSTIRTGTLSTTPLAALGADAAGQLFYATDYKHWYRWDGTAWDFADSGSEYIVRGEPNGGLWALCDGNNALFAQPDGSLSLKATEDLSEDAFGEVIFPVAGNNIGSRTNAAPPKWDPSHDDTETESAPHTHSITLTPTAEFEVTGAGDAYRGGTVATGNPSATHTHQLTDANAKLLKPNVANGGLPLYKKNVYYQRQ